MLKRLIWMAALCVSGLGCDDGGADPVDPPIMEPEAQPDAEPEAQPDAEPEAQPDAEPEAQPDAEPDVLPEPDAEPEAPPRTALQPLPALADWDEFTAAAFDPVVADAQIVGLGEAYHGIGGLHQVRAPIIQRMVTHHGARTLFIEGPWLQARLADDYVLTCEGDVEDALAGFFYYIWFDAALRDTLDWLCTYNQTHADDPVRVFGMDIQNSFDDVTGLEAWLPELTDDAAGIVEQLRQCPNAGFEDARAIIAGQSIAEPSQPECDAGLNALDQLLMGAEDSEAAVLSGLAATSLRAVVALSQAEGSGRMTARDTGMADLVSAQWDSAAPAIVYMANSHASRAHDQTADPNYPAAGGRSVGTVLAERVGDGYVAIGTTGGLLGVNRRGTATLIDNTGPGSVSALLRNEGIEAPVTLIDFKADDAGDLPEADGQMIFFGRPYAVRFARQFDAIVHLIEAAPMFDAVAAAYDGPYLFDWSSFLHADPVAYEQAPYASLRMNGTGVQSAWELHVRQRTLPAFDTPIDLAGSNAVELFLTRNNGYWFAVRGTVTYTGTPDAYDVTGSDLVFWPLYAQSWVVPGSAAIRIGAMQTR